MPITPGFLCAICLRTRNHNGHFPEVAATLISGLAVCREHSKDVPSSTLDQAVERVRARTTPPRERDPNR